MPPYFPHPALGQNVTPRNDAVHVGMMIEVLSPCVEDCRETDNSAKMLGIGSDHDQRLGGGLEQNAVDLGLVLIGDCSDLRRQREHDVEVGDWQQFGFARFEPFLSRRPLALGTMPVAT